MKTTHVICLTLALWSCKDASHSESSGGSYDNVAIANKFVDAFYSFNGDSLKSVLSRAIGSQPNILYYQKWAECGNYEIIKRSDCVKKNDSTVVCPVTVKDDLIGALQINFNVTDSFRITVINGHIRAVETSSNDPDEYYEAKKWIKETQPGLIEKPCEGIWEGGPTPCECVQAMVKGMGEFHASHKMSDQ